MMKAMSMSFSLPTQRCFSLPTILTGIPALFSAYAEVFRGFDPSGPSVFSFSLPTQRCFPPGSHEPGQKDLFSAYAEVFP